MRVHSLSQAPELASAGRQETSGPPWHVTDSGCGRLESLDRLVTRSGVASMHYCIKKSCETSIAERTVPPMQSTVDLDIAPCMASTYGPHQEVLCTEREQIRDSTVHRFYNTLSLMGSGDFTCSRMSCASHRTLRQWQCYKYLD